MGKSVRFSTLLAFLLLILPYQTSPQTNISAGIVNGKWLKQNSPYYIDGEIKIPRGKKLVIFAAVLGARRYVQSHTLDTPLNAMLAESRGMPAAYDGITELWYDSLDDLNGSLLSSEGQAAAAALLEDEKRFIDFARSRLFVTEEHTVIG